MSPTGRNKTLLDCGLRGNGLIVSPRFIITLSLQTSLFITSFTVYKIFYPNSGVHFDQVFKAPRLLLSRDRTGSIFWVAIWWYRTKSSCAAENFCERLWKPWKKKRFVCQLFGLFLNCLFITGELFLFCLIFLKKNFCSFLLEHRVQEIICSFLNYANGSD